MSTRVAIVGGNWKMNTDLGGATALGRAVASGCGGLEGVEVVVFPPSVYLLAVGEAVNGDGSSVLLGGQDVYYEGNGAFTGELSASMLVDCGCRWVLTGHSERRHVIGETDEMVNRKTRAALEAGLSVVLCVGETRDQRDAGETDAVNRRQLAGGLDGVESGDLSRVVVAYEPVWAIGTGLTATPEDAQGAHGAIRETIAELYDEEIARCVRIQYGGSVKPSNAVELFACPDIDGGLIGGASLNAGDFGAIVEAASRSTG